MMIPSTGGGRGWWNVDHYFGIGEAWRGRTRVTIAVIAAAVDIATAPAVIIIIIDIIIGIFNPNIIPSLQ